MEEVKRCSGCKRDLPVESFGLDVRVPSGRQSRCRDCDAKAKLGEYRNMPPEEKRKFLDNLKVIGKKHREKKRRLGICATCTKPAASGFTHCQQHREDHNERQKFRTERARNEGLCLACGCRPQLPGYKHCRVCKDRSKEYWDNLRCEVRAAYGGCCQCCGETGILFLTVDHVLNNGAAHRRYLKMSGAGHTFYLWLKKQGFPQEDFQLLCMQCNWGKKMNGGICPHQTDPTGHPLPKRS